MVIRRVHSCPPGAHTPEWRTKLQFWGCLVKTKYSLGLSLGILEKMRTFLSRGAGSWVVMLESLSAQPYCFHCSVLQQFCLDTSNPNPNPVGMAGRTEEWKESHRPTWFFFFFKSSHCLTSWPRLCMLNHENCLFPKLRGVFSVVCCDCCWIVVLWVIRSPKCPPNVFIPIFSTV